MTNLNAALTATAPLAGMVNSAAAEPSIEETPAGFQIDVYRKLKESLDFARRELNWTILNKRLADIDVGDIVDRIEQLEETIAYLRDDDVEAAEGLE